MWNPCVSRSRHFTTGSPAMCILLAISYAIPIFIHFTNDSLFVSLTHFNQYLISHFWMLPPLQRINCWQPSFSWLLAACIISWRGSRGRGSSRGSSWTGAWAWARTRARARTTARARKSARTRTRTRARARARTRGAWGRYVAWIFIHPSHFHQNN